MSDLKNYVKSRMASDAEFKSEYDALATEYGLKSQLIKARNEKGLTQKQLSELIGVPQSHISRLESGSYNPSLRYLQKIARGLGKELHITFV